MKISLMKLKVLFSVMLMSGVFLSANASAQVEPFLYFSGNYQFDAGTNMLTFSDNYADWIDYTDYSDPSADPILGAALSFGTLTNTISNPLVFSPSSFTVEGFFTATLSNFIVNNSELMWGSLSNIQRLDSGASRYVDELLTYGGGVGNIYISFTPTAGDGSGIESFTATSSGATGGMVAAPEPISAVLFVTGGAALALRKYRSKKNS